MAAKCVLTGKKTVVGNNVSHSKVKTKRRLYPNLQKKRIFIPELGKTVTVVASTRALRSMKKNGTLNFIRQMQRQGSRIAV